MEQPIWNFEQEPSDRPMDETSVNLRAYFDRMPDEKMQQYSPALTDEQLMEWDGNFKNDGDFMTFCSERRSITASRGARKGGRGGACITCGRKRLRNRLA